jgi:glycosyltransferase involved in cell wall biosynthesis
MYSIIIPTQNRINYLQKCLQSLQNLISSKEIEIIIVNDASSDRTKSFLESIQNEKIKILHHSKQQGPSQSRNDGFKISQGEIILFIDDDCEASPSWISEMEKTLQNPNIQWTFGKVIYMDQKHQASFPERIVENRGVWPMGANLAFRRKVIEKEKFDSFFDPYHNEDTELAIRLSQKYPFKKTPQAIVYHQKSFWDKSSLLKSAKNQSVWPILLKKYQKNIPILLRPPLLFGFILSFQDYLFLIFAPILIPLLLARYLFKGQRNLKIFFTKWPYFFILKRFYIFKESLKNKIFII